MDAKTKTVSVNVNLHQAHQLPLDDSTLAILFHWLLDTSPGTPSNLTPLRGGRDLFGGVLKAR